MKKFPDKKDLAILSELDRNSRQSNAAIGKRLGASKDVVNYHIKKLESAGLIRGYYTVIDFCKLGYFSVRVYHKLLDATPETEQRIVDYLVASTKVFFISQTDGYVDLCFGTWVRSIYEFESFYLEFKKRFKEAIGTEHISFFTQAHHFHRAYLLGNPTDEIKEETFGRSEAVPHDATDLAILRLIARDARVSTMTLARRLQVPAATIAFRIKQMEKKGIIQGYRFILDFKLLGYAYYKVDLTLRETSRLAAMISYAHSHPNIIYVDQTVGGSDFEFDVEVENKEAFQELLKGMRTRFPEIRSWTFFELRKYAKLLYFPEETEE